MKLQSFLSVAALASLSTAFNLPRDLTNFEKRQSIASTFVTAINAGYGKVAGSGRLPTKVDLPSAHPEVPGFKTVKIRYGPYKVPNMDKTTITLKGPEEGALWNYPDTNIQKPCTGDCVIVGIKPDYEDLQGNSVNVDEGHWLHHIVLLNSNKQPDPTCAARGSSSLPHWVVAFNPSSSERFFASGNERTTIRLFDHNITDAGYPVKRDDKFAMIVDLMNMNKVDNTAYVVITYDIIEGKMPAGMGEIKPLWLDVDQCGFSEASAKSQDGSYAVTSSAWRANFDGELIVMGGHIHDGGTTLLVKQDGKLACDSRAAYGETAKYISGGGHGNMAGAPAAQGAPAAPEAAGGHAGHGGANMPHISSMVTCWRNNKELKVPEIKQGQVWTVEAKYDYKERAGATHPNGKQENVMGIAIVWTKKKAVIAPPRAAIATPKSATAPAKAANAPPKM